ncbi:MAG: glycosyltransferase [Proteobacteria bacterium]|nr:glycosyltransferase [Pseudomonadota bacterium]
MNTPLSIITAIHNGLPMNRLFWKALTENTQTPFELIIVDNHSTDGSGQFFRALEEETRGQKHEVVYLPNSKNQSYPRSQIQGMEAARYEVLCFLNNDIWMPQGWEKPFVEALQADSRLILSPSGQEAQPTQLFSTNLKRRWKNILSLSKVWAFLLHKTEEERLWKSLSWMYGDLKNFVSPTPNDQEWMPGIKGDSVIFHRELSKIIGSPWDLRIQAADWHLYLTAASYHEKDPSFPLPRVLLKSYIHHFGRYSARQTYEPLEDRESFKTIEEIWDPETVKRLWWGFHLPQE